MTSQDRAIRWLSGKIPALPELEKEKLWGPGLTTVGAGFSLAGIPAPPAFNGPNSTRLAHDGANLGSVGSFYTKISGYQLTGHPFFRICHNEFKSKDLRSHI
jgi:hypothetical protein